MVLESKFYKILFTICVSLSLISKCLSKCLNYWYQSEIVYTLNTPHDDFHRNRCRSSSSGAHNTTYSIDSFPWTETHLLAMHSGDVCLLAHFPSVEWSGCAVLFTNFVLLLVDDVKILRTAEHIFQHSQPSRILSTTFFTKELFYSFSFFFSFIFSKSLFSTTFWMFSKKLFFYVEKCWIYFFPIRSRKHVE